jgi:hypothetical protein
MATGSSSFLKRQGSWASAVALPAADGDGCPYLAAQRHCGPHWQFGLQAQVGFDTLCGLAGFWQPQVHCAPPQDLQVHSIWVVVFIAVILSM